MHCPLKFRKKCYDAKRNSTESKSCICFFTDKPTPPMGPLEIIEASQNAIEVKWRSPKDDGGCKILNYILERQQIGRNTWKKLGPIGPEAHYKDSDVDHGRRYCYKIRADTEMGTSELMETEDVQAGTKGGRINW